MPKAKKKFVRRDSVRYSKIGKNRKKIQRWRKPKGRDSKMRLKRFGYSKSPGVGYKKEKKEYGKINGKEPKNVYNIKDLENSNKKNIIVIGKVGAKKKIEIVKKAIEMKFEILNMKEAKTHAVK